MSEQEKCSRCGTKRSPMLDCGSTEDILLKDGSRIIGRDGIQCLRNQRDQLQQRVAELEERPEPDKYAALVEAAKECAALQFEIHKSPDAWLKANYAVFCELQILLGALRTALAALEKR